MDVAIEIEDLRVRRGGRPVLDDVSLTVRAGRVTGLLGPSGCGKSTMMRAIVGVQIVESGRVTVLGEPAGSSSLRPRVGYVTQAPSVYGDLSVRENLRYFARVLGVGQGRVDEVIDTVTLTEHGDQVVNDLSGGERDLWTRVAELAEGGTALLVSSHVMDEAEHCDELLLMREGAILAEDSPDGLRSRTGEQGLDEAFLALIHEAEAVP